MGVPVDKHQSAMSLKKPGKQVLMDFEEPAIANNSGTEQLACYEMKLEPIIDKTTYDNFLKAIAMRVYIDFEKTLKDEGIDRPELYLVGFDICKIESPAEIRMSEYVALNARMIVERAFMNLGTFVQACMPRVLREMDAIEGGDDIDFQLFVESKVQRDLMMEIRAIAMIHIPVDQRFSYINRLKEL